MCTGLFLWFRVFGSGSLFCLGGRGGGREGGGGNGRPARRWKGNRGRTSEVGRREEDIIGRGVRIRIYFYAEWRFGWKTVGCRGVFFIV